CARNEDFYYGNTGFAYW
nr:immunoglobulin heavy chain junction region [Mus musculus]